MVRKALLAAPDVCSHFYYSSSILSWDALFSWLDIYKREREREPGPISKMGVLSCMYKDFEYIITLTGSF